MKGSKIMISIFVCSTQFQLILSAMVSQEIRSKVSHRQVLLVDVYRDSLKTFVRDNKEEIGKIWDEVYYINDNNSSNKSGILNNKLNGVKILFKVKKEIEEIFRKVKTTEIKEIYIATGTYYSYVTKQLSRLGHQNNCIINIIEDGTSTYIYSKAKDNDYIIKESKKIRNHINAVIKHILMYFLRYNNFDYDMADKIYVLNKDIYIGDESIKNKLIDIEVRQAISINLSMYPEDNIKDINRTDIIYFSQNIFDYEDEMIFLENLLSECNYCYKPHPSADNIITNNKILDSVPWEILCNYIEEDLIFISIASTAVFTPLLMYNKKNKAILLYKVLDINISKKLDEFFIKVQNIYKDRVYVPEDSIQLQNVLKNIKK